MIDVTVSSDSLANFLISAYKPSWMLSVVLIHISIPPVHHDASRALGSTASKPALFRTEGPSTANLATPRGPTAWSSTRKCLLPIFLGEALTATWTDSFGVLPDT